MIRHPKARAVVTVTAMLTVSGLRVHYGVIEAVKGIDFISGAGPDHDTTRRQWRRKIDDASWRFPDCYDRARARSYSTEVELTQSVAASNCRAADSFRFPKDAKFSQPSRSGKIYFWALTGAATRSKQIWKACSTFFRACGKDLMARREISPAESSRCWRSRAR